MRPTTIEKWERIGLVISILIIFASASAELFANCLTVAYPTIFSIITGLAGGVIATILVLYLERKHELNRLFKYYSKYHGCYERIEMGQDNTSDENLIPQRSDNIGLLISMAYQGGHEFSLNINYWKSENAIAVGFVEFNPKDKKSGKGNYRYTQGVSFNGHYGKLELSWNESKNEMLVFYHHQYPRTLPFNPDNNRGWEVWKKTEFSKCKTK
jgi:hypothetical protein